MLTPTLTSLAAPQGGAQYPRGGPAATAVPKLRRLLLLTLAVIVAPALSHAAATSAVVTTEQVRAELVAHAPEGVAPGKPVWLGLQIAHQPDWHTYWKNPGDSGLPTTLAWQLPAGVSAGDIAWPTPKRLPVGPLMNYGYEGKLLLPVPVTVSPAFNGNALDIKLSAQWLVCKDVCIPQQGEFALSIPVQASTAAHAAAFAAAQAALPQPASGAEARAELVDDAKVLRVSVSGLPAALRGRELAFFAETAGVVEHAVPISARWDGGTWQARVPISAQRFESPARMQAVLVPPGAKAGVQVGFAIAGAWPALVTPAPPAAQTEAPRPAAPVQPPVPSIGFGVALLFALVGGALLNLMPCVFPILSLKLLGFAGHAHSRRALLGGGLAYSAGVVLSFVALAALLLVLRAGGEQIGWGFQLQSPLFIAALAVLFTVIALNLAGLFEFGTLLPSGLASMRLRHPLADSALTGVLAVAVASPCTAPFMGAALGLAFTLPPLQALSVFATLGVGMALPYLAASAWPRLARAMPKPGVWMATFKTALAFPMLATVVWLAWVLGQQTGIDGVTALLSVLVALAFALWAWGRIDSGGIARTAWSTAGVLLLGMVLAWALPSWREAHATPSTPAADARWQPWSPSRVAALNAEGRSVFVDFTAAWCVTCQLNKRTTLGDAAVLADFDAGRVVLMRADWTRRDAAISAELARLGRNGVPVYAIYKAGQAAPTLLPELLSPQLLRDALAAP
jgi:thiol:disulfide interchange protein/DsbC/DsbD-like thiol-disulfide interchange protein